MKKRITAIACCALISGIQQEANAQSSVVLQGNIDAGVTFINNQHGGSATRFDSGILAPNQLTFKGDEDLGGGNKALFVLTSQFDLANGTTIPGPGQMFGRDAYIGLSNDRYGQLTFGNQYDFMFETLTAGLFDNAFLMGGIYDFRGGPFTGLGIPNNPTGAFDFDRMAGSNPAMNSVKYKSPTVYGFSFGALYGFGGTPGDFSANSTVSVGGSYASGPLGIGFAYTSAKYVQLDNGHGAIRNIGAGVNYHFGPVLAMLLYTNTKNTASNATVNVIKPGINWTVSGPWSVGLDYTYMKGNSALQNTRAQQVMGAVQYHLSKRTLIYVEGIYEHANGDATSTDAWINGIPQAASTGNQVIGRVGMFTVF
ncbi:porin [Paraburkholderia sp. D1E]|uniref:porin n=1 Tax=Paraburkholderia sp. D1E TaxID=3461398 RepID=UPI0040453466